VAASPLRIALLGGVPPSLGGGGLELQLRRTSAALERIGHEVFHVAREPSIRPFDVLHVFSSGPDVHFALEHWRRNPAPLVVTSVIVVAQGTPELRQRVGSRLPIPAFGPRMRREILRRADAVVAASEYEAELVRDFAGRGVGQVIVIGNGADPVAAVPVPDGLPTGYAALVGTVSARKRQAETVAALAAHGLTAVVAGGFDGGADERARFEERVAAAGGRWLGELDEPSTRAVMREARALVHLSSAEAQSLAIIEALAEGTPVVVSPLPVNRELVALYGDRVRLCERPEDVGAILAGLQAPGSGRRPAPPTWDDVASQLVDVYRTVCAHGR
jgi:glycosyltransferase involved in cell wall biosynthesis